MKIKFIYRNYKAPHPVYQSILDFPPESVHYFFREPLFSLRSLYPLFSSFSHAKIFSWFSERASEMFFAGDEDLNDVDLLHYANMLPSGLPQKPFVIDFEHISALFGFSPITPQKKEHVWDVISHQQCQGILPWSYAAKKTLEQTYPERFESLDSKIKVLYPAVPCYKNDPAFQVSHEIVNQNIPLKILFVGNEYQRKGLPELLEAAICLNESHFEFYIVSDVPSHIRKKYVSFYHIHFYPSQFKKKELIEKFFLACDVFVLPTHADTFGLVLLDALASGLPVMTTDQFAAAEIIQPEENGWLLTSDYLYLNDHEYLIQSQMLKSFSSKPDLSLVDQLKELLQKLSENNSTLKKLASKTVLPFQHDGQFSLSRRNNVLLSVYNNSSYNDRGYE